MFCGERKNGTRFGGAPGRRAGKNWVVLHFYFDFNDEAKQKLEDTVRSLTSQLALLHDVCQKLLDALSSCSDGRRQPSCDELCKLFLAMLKNTNELWIVIDALDESTSRTGGSKENVLAWLKEILRNRETIVHMLATSRPERDIENAINNMEGCVQRISVQAEYTQQDIRSYMSFRLQEDFELQRWQRMRSEIESLIYVRQMACEFEIYSRHYFAYRLQVSPGRVST